ncbi:MAG: DUF11 domain-containing protein [Parvularculaceae bacterium]|nr:DUF11 domain-containing protein [Parvularculaceae bacterium]
MRHGGVIKGIARGFAAILTLAGALTFNAHAAVLGSQVNNVANVNYTIGGANLSVTPPPASFTIEAARTPSTIEFFRYSPNSPDAAPVSLNGSDYQPSPSGAFQPVGPLRSAAGTAIDTFAPVLLAPASAYFAGEPIVIKVSDAGQNGDPAAIETLVATIRTGNGDFVTLRLYESGPDTGEFFAWIPSGSGAPVKNDNTLTIAHGAGLVARYQDPFDATEVSTDTAGVDPFGRVFDSLTGALIDGATVSIVDDATGLPAIVYGIDGVSAYPSTIVTGQTVTDGGGMVYPLGPGEFRFPIMMPGAYRLIVTPPAGYVAPSTVAAPSFAGLQNAPFIIIPGSYGKSFSLTGTGDVELDFPIDPITDLVVIKEADVDSASIGDFVRYRISIENRAASAARVRIADVLPQGFRYQAGSTRLDGAMIVDPFIDAGGGSLTFDLGLIPATTTVQLAYVAEVASGAAAGPAVNRAQAVSLAGAPISNRAEASVDVTDDFLRDSLTIVGRIIEDGCDEEDADAKAPRSGKGVAGVRLYMETGATVVSDENGLYHFENVSPRTHVVQVDEDSLPAGYELVQCKNNTRYAGSVRSQFVDVGGGKIWRANFYLRNKGGLSSEKKPVEKKAFNADKEYVDYDKIWLNQLTDFSPSFAYPAEGVTPSSPSTNIGVKHPAELRPTLFLNGHEVPVENFDGRDVSVMRTVALTRWKGVDLLEGENRFEAVLKDKDGAEVTRVTRNVDYVNTALRANIMVEETRAFADGKTRPVIALKVTDGAGRPVRAGRILNVEIAPPFRAATREAIEQRAPLDAPLSASAGIPVGQNGVALIELEPTVETGLARVKIKLDDGSEKTFTTYVKPALRDWIVVGLAEGEGALEKGKGALRDPKGSALIGDGRIAGFAKGTIKGDWLVTVAGDSKNERGSSDEELFDVIDPDDRYPLYGDRTTQRFEAQSRYPIYLKAEKNGFKAQFGDYQTGMTDSKLSRYDRRLSGLQTVYESDRFAFTGFAAETNQAFIKDELAADGTSGPYALSATPLVRNSESIIVETRNRFRPDEVIGAITLVRYADYDIDFETGEIIFRLPVPAADAAFNPNVIIVDYETASPVDRNLTAGGRGAVRFLSGRGEVGASFIHEEAPGVSGERTNLAGADLNLDITDKDHLRVEYATTLRDGPAVNERADAVLAEISHTGDRLNAKAYYARTEPEFGLGQQTSATTGVMRYGAEASLKINEFESKDGASRGARYADAKAYREENLVTGASRDIAEIALRQESNSTSGAVGLRGVREEPQSGPKREGLFAVTSVKQRFDEIGLSVRAAHERPIAGDDGSSLFPTRYQLGFDQRLFEGLTLSGAHEVLDGEAISQSNTTVGLTAEPWTGGKVTLSSDRLTQDSSENIGATLGVDQQVRLSEKWTGSLGMARRENLKEQGAVDAPDDIVPDIPRSPFEETGGAYTSLYVGAGYRSEATSGSSRFEMKKTDAGQRYMVAAGAARELSEQFSFAGAGRFQADNNELVADERRFDLRLGASWRPHDDGLIVFNRFDVKQRKVDLDSESWKAVHNLTLNAALTERLELAFNHGFKYAVLRADGDVFDGVTELVGVEARYDVTDRIDIGFHGEGHYSFNAKTLNYSYGPSIGFTPADNVWFSFGWNFAGFVDEDFAAAEYSRAGPYLKLRIKFDQTTARGLLDAISPERAQ